MLMDSAGPPAPAPFTGRDEISPKYCDAPGAPLPARPALPTERAASAIYRPWLWEARPAAMLALLDLLDCFGWRQDDINSASSLPDGFPELRTASCVKREKPMNRKRRP